MSWSALSRVVQLNQKDGGLEGNGDTLAVSEEDEMTCKLMMLIEGECEGLGPFQAAKMFGYTKQRYFQLR